MRRPHPVSPFRESRRGATPTHRVVCGFFYSTTTHVITATNLFHYVISCVCFEFTSTARGSNFMSGN